MMENDTTVWNKGSAFVDLVSESPDRVTGHLCIVNADQSVAGHSRRLVNSKLRKDRVSSTR